MVMVMVMTVMMTVMVTVMMVTIIDFVNQNRGTPTLRVTRHSWHSYHLLGPGSFPHWAVPSRTSPSSD